MTENVNRMMVNPPVFPSSSVNAGEAGGNEERITSLEIATMTNKLHKNVMQSIRKMEVAWVKVNGLGFKLVNYQDQKGETRPCYSLTKRESLYIATKFNDEARAKLILRWEELEIKHREQAQAKMQAEQVKPQQSFLQDKLTVANWVMDSLRYSDAARLQLVSQIAKPYGVPVPDYVHAPNGASHAVSELLKERGVVLSAIKFNKLALAAGLLEEKTRKGTNGKVHKYYSVTEKGLVYALNDIYKDVPGQTIPKWYDNKFGEVLEIIGYKSSEQTDMFASGEAHN
jgi:phage regulator Rha-like protein